MSWDGKVLLTTGVNAGTQWKDLNRNSVEWYRDKGKNPRMKDLALLEISRRNKAGEY